MAPNPYTNPIAISSSGGAAPASSALLPPALAQLVQLRAHADSVLHSPQLAHELATGHGGPSAGQAREALQAVLEAAEGLKDKPASAAAGGGKLSAEHEARALFCQAWALSRIGEYDGSDPSSLAQRLNSALDLYARAASLLAVPPPPQLESLPSVTRPQDPKRQAASVDLPEVPGWAAEMLAEWARTQTTLAFSSLLGEEGNTVVDEEKLADLLDIACRRNVQALFTPVDPLSSAEDSPSSAGTVLGSARLLRDILALFPYTSSAPLWARHLAWATHIADVRFVTASMSANRLVDEAAAHAQVLQAPNVAPAERKRVKGVLEKLSRRIAPHERTQGNVLLWLGRVMLDAVGALYLGRSEGFQAERRRREGMEVEEEEEEEDGEEQRKEVPENDLVRETRQVLIRAAALFENAYASILRAPSSSRRRKTELRLLRRLEATYLDLELLDNPSPAVIELRSQRIERALFINDRLVALGDGQVEEDDAGSDHERAAEDEEEEVSSDEEEGLARRFGGVRVA
ncbi:hypothetical protein JCM8097_004085 [Rhodosporidiobolus ruineniae]